jgi:TolB-like protein/Tfp pilus assembly protein PilF
VAFAFGDHRLDLERRELRCGTELVDVQPQVFDLIAYLVQNRDRVVSRSDLLQAVWGGRSVSDSALTTRINAARRAVSDSGAAQQVIRTISRKGVRFVAAVREEDQWAVEPTAGASVSSTTSPAVPPTAPRLSIVVLPFTNLSDDPEQQYFADGITEDLTTNLSRLADMLVISCNTAFTYTKKQIDTRQIGRELRVRYVLEGSVRRSGDRVRVTAQLIDAEADVHLWAERFERATADLFALQDEVTSQMAVALSLELVRAEGARATDNPDALDCILRGRAARLRPNSRDVYAEAIPLFEHALRLDPQSAEAQSRLADTLVSRVMNGLTDSAAADLARAEGLVGRALATSPQYAYPHIVKGRVLRAQNQWVEATPEYEMALALDRNFVAAFNGLGWCKLYAGLLDEAIPLAEQAIRLSPRDPGIGGQYYLIGTVKQLQSHNDEAIAWYEKARSAWPAVPEVRSRLASVYAFKGETERASIELAEARRLNGGDLFTSIAHRKAGIWQGVPKIRDLYEATYFAGLRKAGMPEE